jgi:hypothetical protein
VADVHQVRGGGAVEIGQVARVIQGNHQKVARIDRLDVHERGAALVAIDEGARELSRHDAAKDTTHPGELVSASTFPT